MKKILCAVALAAMLPLFVSCGGEQNNNNDNNFNEPRFVQSAGQLIPASGELQSIDLSESGIYVVGEAVANPAPAAWHPGTKSDGGAPEVKYIAGTYDVSGRVYNLNGWGTIEFDNTASASVDLKYTKSGKGAVTVKASFAKSQANNDIYRTWRVDKTRVNVTEGQTTYGADFVGCDFSEIAEFIRKNGHAIPDDIPAGTRISTLSITGSGSIIIIMNDSSVKRGSCTVSGSSISYNLAASSMGYSFEAGSANYGFMDGKCILTFKARVNGVADASFTMVLSDTKS